MAVIIHPGKCDQAKECSCPDVCVCNAWNRNDKDDKWIIDNEKCNDCGLCIKECPAEAVYLAKTVEEEENILKMIEEDSENTHAKLFTERYGAMPVISLVQDINEFINKIKSSNPVFVEFFNNDSILCLIQCLQYRNFSKEFEVCKINTNKFTDLIKNYNLKKFPTLCIFRNSKEIGRFEGFSNNEDELISFVKNVLE